MAKEKINQQNEQITETETLLENMRALELENKTLKEQNESLNLQIATNEKTIEELQENLSNNTNNDEQQEQIQNLINERDTLAEQLEAANKNNETHADSIATENEELKQKLQKTTNELEELRSNYESLQNHVSGLVEENKKKPTLPKNTITLSAFAYGVLMQLRNKLAEFYNKPELKPNAILEDYLLKYNIFRWTEWFHAFVLTDKDIIEEAQKINPNIKSIKDLQAAANITDKNEN